MQGCDLNPPPANRANRSLLILLVSALTTVLVACGQLQDDGNENDSTPAGHSTAPIAQPGEVRPYSANSAWNLKIGPAPSYDPDSAIYVAQLNGIFGANPNTYSTPVYIVSAQTPLRDVVLSSWWSNVVEDGQRLILERGVTVKVPIPDNAMPAAGKDSNICLWNPETGEEWGFWQAVPLPSGDWMSRNGYHYNTRWNAVPPEGFVSRGAGIPYLAGLVRPWELRAGRIDHAIAFAVNYPSSFFVHPATKSDGDALPPALPEGARLQLDPALTERDFQRWGLSKEGQIIARALQEYGMILTDGSGHPKLSVEYEGTANWGSLLDKDIVRRIPYSAFKVLDLKTPAQPASPQGLTAEVADAGIVLRWQPVQQASSYRILRRQFPSPQVSIMSQGLTVPTYTDPHVTPGGNYEYAVQAISHNGISAPSAIAAIAIPGKQ